MAEAAAGRMHFWDAFWDFRVAECPCDADFVEWLDETGITDATIYHFGTGGHHHVGVQCAAPHRRNAVIGITAAPQEHETFVKLAIEHPEVLRYYMAVFSDIYLVNPRLLPDLDVATLFHLNEFRGPENDAYGALTDMEVAETIVGRVKPGGHVLFFPGSFAYDNARRIVAALEESGRIAPVGRYKSLLVHRKT